MCVGLRNLMMRWIGGNYNSHTCSLDNLLHTRTNTSCDRKRAKELPKHNSFEITRLRGLLTIITCNIINLY